MLFRSYNGTATAARMATITMTTINSMRVKPFWFRFIVLLLCLRLSDYLIQDPVEMGYHMIPAGSVIRKEPLIEP